ncbi:MAG: hypothetical protein O3C65_09415 [Proteobacteria bacterium]|nr:hypothetical protein [Pseudomonadota bacterium]
MTAFAPSTPSFGPWQRFVASGQTTLFAVRRWEARRRAAAQTRSMTMQQLRAMGLRSPQALAVRYGVPVPASED